MLYVANLHRSKGRAQPAAFLVAALILAAAALLPGATRAARSKQTPHKRSGAEGVGNAAMPHSGPRPC
jgi:hypothetical protein